MAPKTANETGDFEESPTSSNRDSGWALRGRHVDEWASRGTASRPEGTGSQLEPPGDPRRRSLGAVYFCHIGAPEQVTLAAPLVFCPYLRR